MRFPRRARSDRGASMVLVAISLLLLLGASAVAVDLAAMRLDRSADQRVTDSAASAGALAARESNGQAACEAALGYVAINSEAIASIDTSGCVTEIPATCDPGMPESHSVSTGRFDITFWYPVDDGHDLMTSAQLGAPKQGIVPDDGEPCQRVGVQMSATHTSFFAQLIGFDQGTTTVHSVSRAFIEPSGEPPLNLAVLDRHECNAIHVAGSPGSGVIVEAVIDPDTGVLHPGVASADSDTTPSCSTAVIRMEGSNTTLRADGPDGCPDELASGSGHGCGRILVIPDNLPPPCSPLACLAGGGNHPDPAPTQMPGPITRQQIDHLYNCYNDYDWSGGEPGGFGAVSWATDALTVANEQDIDDCANYDGSNDHIYNLIDDVGETGDPSPSLGSFPLWTALGHPCDVPSSGPAISVPHNVRVNCSTLTVRKGVTITGDVIFDGNVHVTSDSSHLNIQNTEGFAFFRNGTLTKDSSANLTFQDTLVYMSKNSRVDISGKADGSDGQIVWVAPNSGRFNDLALWSDWSTDDQGGLAYEWAGQGDLKMIGVFFTPIATADYSGTSGQNQTEAQWIADKLIARGGGELVVTPRFEFPFKPPDAFRTTIIR